MQPVTKKQKSEKAHAPTPATKGTLSFACCASDGAAFLFPVMLEGAGVGVGDGRLLVGRKVGTQLGGLLGRTERGAMKGAAVGSRYDGVGEDKELLG